MIWGFLGEGQKHLNLCALQVNAPIWKRDCAKDLTNIMSVSSASYDT